MPLRLIIFSWPGAVAVKDGDSGWFGCLAGCAESELVEVSVSMCVKPFPFLCVFNVLN